MYAYESYDMYAIIKIFDCYLTTVIFSNNFTNKTQWRRFKIIILKLCIIKIKILCSNRIRLFNVLELNIFFVISFQYMYYQLYHIKCSASSRWLHMILKLYWSLLTEEYSTHNSSIISSVFIDIENIRFLSRTFELKYFCYFSCNQRRDDNLKNSISFDISSFNIFFLLLERINISFQSWWDWSWTRLAFRSIWLTQIVSWLNHFWLADG